MKKIFTLAAGLAVSALSFSASAASYEGVNFQQLSNTELIIYFTEAASLECTADALNNVTQAYVEGEDNTPQYILNNCFTLANTSDNSYVKINITNLYLEEGDYKLVVPADYFILYLSPDYKKTTLDYEMEFGFTVGEGDSEPIVYSPQFSDVNDNIFTIKWVSASGIQADLEEGSNTGAELEDVNGFSYVLTPFEDGNYSQQNIRIDNNVVIINLTNGFLSDLQPGTYTLTIPAGFLLVNGVANQPVTHTFTYGGVFSEGEVFFNLQMDDVVSATWSGADSVELNSAYFENMFADGITIYDSMDNTKYIAGSDVTAEANSLYISYGEYDLAPGLCKIVIPAGYVYVTIGETSELNSEQTGYFEIEEGAASVTASFNISGIENAANFVSISYFDRGDFEEKTVSIEDNNASVTVLPGTNFTLQPEAGYMLEVTTFAEESVATVSSPSDLEGEWNVSISWEPSETFASFFVTVSKAPASINLNFTSESDLINGNPQDYVTVTSQTEITLSDDSNKIYIPEVGDGLEFTLTPVNGYEIASVIVRNGDDVIDETTLFNVYYSMITRQGDSYLFLMSKDANGLTITVDVEDTVEGIGIAMAFEGDDLEEDAYTYVSILVDGTTYANPESNNYTYMFKGNEGLQFEFIPEYGYLVEVECVTENGDPFGRIYPGDLSTNSVYLSLGGLDEYGYLIPIPEGLSVTISVSKDPTVGIDSIQNVEEDVVIYNINGVRQSGKNLAPGLYIINGKKVMIRK